MAAFARKTFRTASSRRLWEMEPLPSSSGKFLGPWRIQKATAPNSGAQSPSQFRVSRHIMHIIFIYTYIYIEREREYTLYIYTCNIYNIHACIYYIISTFRYLHLCTQDGQAVVHSFSTSPEDLTMHAHVHARREGKSSCVRTVGRKS